MPAAIVHLHIVHKFITDIGESEGERLVHMSGVSSIHS